jgi:hypothetical protein
MSCVRDDLSQWRAYGGGEGGVSIVFDPARLLTPKYGYLVPVRYQPNDHKLLANDLAKRTMQFFKNGLVRRAHADRQRWADAS